MAGWKLRKDKAAAETPGTDDETPDSELQTHSTPEAPFLDAVPGLPDFDSDADSALTLVDYTEPSGEAAAPGTHAHLYETPDPAESAVIAMPPLEAPASAEAEPEPEFEHEMVEPLSASSSWLSSDFSAETPAVAPFVLNTPAPAAPIAAPQIVVHIGRLSAPFALTKDVTTLGRPDSTLSYYPDVEIEMDDAVSRRHCEIVKRESDYYLVDTGSTNGTRLNGETLLPHQEHLLAHGDRIHLGDRTEITFE